PTMNQMGVPLVIDFAKTPEDRQAMELVLGQLVFGRPYILPPGVPEERVTALRKAFMDTLADKDLLAEAAKARLDIIPSPARRCSSSSPRCMRRPPPSSSGRARR